MEVQNTQETQTKAVLDNTISNVNQKPMTALNIQEWIVCYLAELLQIPPEQVNTKIPFDRYGLDSASAIGLTGDLEDYFGIKIDPTLLYDYPTVESFSQHLAEEFQAKV